MATPPHKSDEQKLKDLATKNIKTRPARKSYRVLSDSMNGTTPQPIHDPAHGSNKNYLAL